VITYKLGKRRIKKRCKKETGVGPMRGGFTERGATGGVEKKWRGGRGERGPTPNSMTVNSQNVIRES